MDVRASYGGNDAIAIESGGDNDVFVRMVQPDGTAQRPSTRSTWPPETSTPVCTAPVVVTAGGGSDVVRLNDQNNSFSDAFDVTAAARDGSSSRG